MQLRVTYACTYPQNVNGHFTHSVRRRCGPAPMSIIHFTYVSELRRGIANCKRRVNHHLVKRNPRQSRREKYHCPNNWKQRWKKHRRSYRSFSLVRVAGIFLRESRNLNEQLPTERLAIFFFQKTTKRTLARMKSLYESFRTRRVMGFKCDLKRCESTLMECSARSCKKKSMIFGGPSHHDPEMIDLSISNASTTSTASGKP